MDSIIKAENVCKTYDMGAVKVNALSDINVELIKGDFVSIVGPSGSGKTTLLDILSALLRPDCGEIYIRGKPISKMSDSELAKVRGKTIGFVFQNYSLINRITALENVMLPLWFQGYSQEMQEKIAKNILAEVGLSDRIYHKPTELSGGQKQRVSIARALAVDPDIIVADEPTGNLDSNSGAAILSLFKDLHEKKGKTILIVTHERAVAELADRIINIKDGRIISIDSVHKKENIIRGGYK